MVEDRLKSLKATTDLQVLHGLFGALCFRTQGTVDERQGINGGSQGDRCQSSSLYSCRRAQTQHTLHGPSWRRVDVYGQQSQAFHDDAMGSTGKREASLREEPRLASLSLSSPTRREEIQFHAARGKQQAEKNPNQERLGSAHTSCRPFPSKGRLSAREGRSPGSRRLSTLCTFPRPNTSVVFADFRSAHSCGAAMDLHHLPWSQPQTVTSPTSGICNSGCELTAVRTALSRTFLPRRRCLTPKRCERGAVWDSRCETARCRNHSRRGAPVRGDLTAQEAVTRATGITATGTPGDSSSALASRGFVGHDSVTQLYDGLRLCVGAAAMTFPVIAGSRSRRSAAVAWVFGRVAGSSVGQSTMSHRPGASPMRSSPPGATIPISWGPIPRAHHGPRRLPDWPYWHQNRTDTWIWVIRAVCRWRRRYCLIPSQLDVSPGF